jgi:hypothetical protein
MHRPPLPPSKYSWYSFLLEAFPFLTALSTVYSSIQWDSSVSVVTRLRAWKTEKSEFDSWKREESFLENVQNLWLIKHHAMKSYRRVEV